MQMAQIAVISGGVSDNSRLNGIENEVISFLNLEGISYSQVKVIDLPADDLIRANFASEKINEAHKKIEEAEAVIVLTPVYKASYSGVLKTYLDLLPQKALEGKPVLPLVIGGSQGHLLVIDFALKPLFAALGATNIQKGVYALDSKVQRLDGGVFKVDPDIQQRLQAELNLLIRQSKQTAANTFV